jgi:hypothetical protein
MITKNTFVAGNDGTGGGGYYSRGGDPSGGSGIVIIRYRT